MTSVRRRWLIATGAAWLAVALSSQSADASCGDWLAGHHGHPATQADPAVADASVPAQPMQGQPATPCQGPSCRSNREAPMAPAPAPELPTHRDVGALLRLIAVAGGLGFQPYPAVEDAAAERGHPLGIEHPPRV